MTNDASLILPHGALRLPVFLPDATRAVVRAIDSADLEAVGIEGLVMSAFHLMQHPGSTTVKALGGLHKMAGWPHPIITDSGGFQAYSMIRQNAKFGSLTDKGIVFRPDAKSKVLLSPEKSVQLQMSYGADVVICLDDCTHPEDNDDNQRESVRRTIAWAKRCKEEFQRLTEASPRRRGDAEKRRKAEDEESPDHPFTLSPSQPPTSPKLFGVIQGGASKDLRKQCADALLEMGFDGFGYGGWPLDSEGELVRDMVAYTRELVPAHLPMHALGIGHPSSIVECFRMGYEMFDSALPTRDARRGRLMTFNQPVAETRFNNDVKWWSYRYIEDDKHMKADAPISEHCNCPTCRRYSRGYLHHLFKVKDASYLRLSTVHNLRFMVQLMDALRTA
jgi:queuine tRNA-ribosyltransferase